VDPLRCYVSSDGRQLVSPGGPASGSALSELLQVVLYVEPGCAGAKCTGG